MNNDRLKDLMMISLDALGLGDQAMGTMDILRRKIFRSVYGYQVHAVEKLVIGKVFTPL